VDTKNIMDIFLIPEARRIINKLNAAIRSLVTSSFVFQSWKSRSISCEIEYTFLAILQ